ncbi:MAG: DUF3311 domain-containing protein [bacterium]|nr:DUF3311 domain-containing protein [bacterium]
MKSRTVIWTLAVVLAVLHQDFWYWDDRSLWFGFIPVGLGYHMLYSLATAALWAAAVVWAWPSEVEEEVDAYLKAHPEGGEA